MNLSQEQIYNTNRNLLNKLYNAMGWQYQSDPDRKDKGYWLRPEAAKIKAKKAKKSKKMLKKKVPCCVCGGSFSKEKMNLSEYESHRIKNDKLIKVVNKKYECNRCKARNKR
jgi:hypothetical protein